MANLANTRPPQIYALTTVGRLVPFLATGGATSAADCRARFLATLAELPDCALLIYTHGPLPWKHRRPQMARNITTLILSAFLVVPTLALAQAPTGGLAPARPSTTAPAATTTPSAPPSPTGGATARPSTSGKTPATSRSTQATALASDQFTTEDAAKASCPSDVIVWENIRSKIYHMSGTRYYGKTVRGAYMCQKAADADGFHQSKGG